MLTKLFVVVLILLGVNTSVFAESKLEKATNIDELMATVPGDFVNSSINVYHQVVLFRYPKEWGVNPVFKKQLGNYFIMEYIPKTQALDTWRDMFSIQGFNDLAKNEDSSPERMMLTMKDRFTSLMPGKVYFREIYRGMVGGYPGIIVLMGIKELPAGLNPTLPKGSGELSLYLFLKGESDMYIIHRSWQTAAPYSENQLPMSKKELERWVGFFKHIRLISPEEFSKKVAPFKKVEFKKKGE